MIKHSSRGKTTKHAAIVTTTAILLMAGPAWTAEPPPTGKIVEETRTHVCPGVEHIRRVTADPLHINVLIADLNEPGVRIGVGLSNDRAAGLETVRSIADRLGAVAAVNGDYWTHHGIPLGLTVVDGEIVVAPKFRTAFGIRRDGTATIGNWNDAWGWNAEVEAADGARHLITMMNSDCNPGWLCLYTDRYGMPTRGASASPVVEAVLNLEHRVLEIRRDQPGAPIPPGGFVLTGRDAAGEWLAAHLSVGDLVRLDLRSARPWQELQHAVGAGPRILVAGAFHQDPVAPLPEGEEFTAEWKRAHYERRHPRTAAGVSRDGRRVILAVVDGRQPEFSLGVHQRRMADLLREFGAWDGMDLDSGGSATMVVRGELVNHPSDHANPDGTGGRERSVADALLVFYDAAGAAEPAPGRVTPEQHDLNILH